MNPEKELLVSKHRDTDYDSVKDLDLDKDLDLSVRHLDETDDETREHDISHTRYNGYSNDVEIDVDAHNDDNDGDDDDNNDDGTGMTTRIRVSADESENTDEKDETNKKRGVKMVKHVGTQDEKLPGYFKHKHWATNFLNVSLLFHNGRELKMLTKLNEDDRDDLWEASVVMVCISILLQITVGILLTIGSFYKVRTDKENTHATRLSNITTVLVLVTTIVDILLMAFNDDIYNSLRHPTSPPPGHHY